MKYLCFNKYKSLHVETLKKGFISTLFRSDLCTLFRCNVMLMLVRGSRAFRAIAPWWLDWHLV